jgi:hypothetical protein
MDENSEDKKIKAVEKTLGEPVSPELSDNSWKIRTNLMFVSVISIAVTQANLHIDPSSTFLGLKFTGINDSVIRNGLLFITIYLGIHFLWTAFDGFLEWRLRITGTRLSFVTSGSRLASMDGDYPNDPRQSTLYHWWTIHAKSIGNFNSNLSKLELLLKELDSDLRDRMSSGVDSLNIVNACHPIGEAIDGIARLSRSIESTQKMINAKRILVSLERFDKWFELFLRSQNLRWLVIDLLVPVILCGCSIYLLCQT